MVDECTTISLAYVTPKHLVLHLFASFRYANFFLGLFLQKVVSSPGRRNLLDY